MRTTIQLPDELLARLRRFAPPRGLNRFVHDAVEARVADLEREELERQMREGYLATRADRRKLNADWKTVDGEGWPD